MGPSAHFSQFYEGDLYLLHSLHTYVKAGLLGGEAVIVVATSAHCERLQELLESDGIDVVLASAAGQYVTLDAAETLAKFMIGDAPDASRFKEVIGAILARAAEGRERMRVFDEMVALLWTDGNHDAALAVESYWNELQMQHSFSLFCGYPLDGFGGEQFREPLRAVCNAHSQIFCRSCSIVSDRLTAPAHADMAAWAWALQSFVTWLNFTAALSRLIVPEKVKVRCLQ